MGETSKAEREVIVDLVMCGRMTMVDDRKQAPLQEDWTRLRARGPYYPPKNMTWVGWVSLTVRIGRIERLDVAVAGQNFPQVQPSNQAGGADNKTNGKPR